MPVLYNYRKIGSLGKPARALIMLRHDLKAAKLSQNNNKCPENFDRAIMVNATVTGLFKLPGLKLDFFKKGFRDRGLMVKF